MKPLAKLMYTARNFFCRRIFRELRKGGCGKVLDVGGWDFFLMATRKGIQFDSWTCLEVSEDKKPDVSDPKFHFVCGDGCDMPFEDGVFDTVLDIQVLEHVYRPIDMVKEVGRVLKPGGRVIFLIPQRGALHAVPHHYCNFTKYWIVKVLAEGGLEILTVR